MTPLVIQRLSASPVPSLQIVYHNVLPKAIQMDGPSEPIKTAFLADASVDMVDGAVLRLVKL